MFANWIKRKAENRCSASWYSKPYVLPITKIIGIGIAVFIVLCGVSSAVKPIGLPRNVCSDDSCSPSQLHIWNRFQKATRLNLALIPSVYSGACYHSSPYFDPYEQHFGGVLLDQQSRGVLFHGRFSFHIQKHPYIDLSVESARQRFPETYEVTMLDMFAYAESSDSLAPFRYWFRQEVDTNDLLIVGYFGWNHTIICALDRHIKKAHD